MERVRGFMFSNMFSNKNTKQHKKRHKGFSLMELIVGIVLLTMVMGILLTITLGGVKNGKFTQTLADVTIITSQKSTEIFNSVTTQIKSIPNGSDHVGSIDPNEPIIGYTDYLNESGCLIKNSSIKQPTLDEPPVKDGGVKGITTSTTSRTGLGDIGNGDTDTGNIDGAPALDCSKSPFASNSTSLAPKFRRQWLVIKNKPKLGDITVGVILVNQANNSIVRSETLVKVDGSSSK